MIQNMITFQGGPFDGYTEFVPETVLAVAFDTYSLYRSDLLGYAEDLAAYNAERVQHNILSRAIYIKDADGSFIHVNTIPDARPLGHVDEYRIDYDTKEYEDGNL
jgi:hypothetical protein